MAAEIPPSYVLGSAVAFCAGLCTSHGDDFVVANLDIALQQVCRREAAHNHFFADYEELNVEGLQDICNLAAAIGPQRSILAVSQLGPAVLTMSLLSMHGLKLATVFWQIGRRDQEILKRSGTLLINLNEHKSGRSLFRELAALQREGYSLALMIDAPMKSRYRYTFLGYQVRCSSMLERYAASFDKHVIPISAELLDSTHLKLGALSSISRMENLTQQLLSFLQNEIYRHIQQYNWSPGSIIFSDKDALINGLRFIDDILEWRSKLRDRYQ